MKLKILPFFVLIFLAFFLLISCDLSSDKNDISQATETEGTEEATESETVTESEKITETEEMTESEEIAESEKTTEPEIITEPESEKITEMEETTETNPIAESEEPSESETVTEPERNESEETESGSNVDSDAPSPYELLCYFDGMVVRWGSVVEDTSFLFGIENVDMEFLSQLVAVNVEVLDTVEYMGSPAEELYSLNRVFVPKNATTDILEGEESVIFVYYEVIGYTEDHAPVYAAVMDPFATIHPIFRFENGRIIIDEAQLETNHNGHCKMRFLSYAYRANRYLEEYGVDETYHFRNGMTVEELEQFYEIVKNLPWDYFNGGIVMEAVTKIKEEPESETRPVYADVDFKEPNYMTLSHFEGAVVRWGDVIDGEITDSEGTGEASSNIFDLLSDYYTTFFVAVNVEVLDVVEHKASKPERIYDLETILIPRLAMPLVTTGEVSLVFFYYSEIYAEDGTSVWIAWVEHALKKLINYPIFDFVDGHMMISDSQMQECLSEEWTSTFLRTAWRISQRCTKVGLNYKFYSGMTIDEWEVFYQKARDLGI